MTNRSRLLTSLLMGLMTINVAVGADSSRPKLVVGIVVDQLRSDYISYLRGLFGDKGFNRLLRNGLYLQNVDFRTDSPDAVAATAVIYTGNYAPVSGIPSAYVFNHTDARPVAVLEDKNSMGNFTREALSPGALRISTVSDEIAIDGDGLTSVYAIAPDAQQAIIMAGHAGSCALWINDTDGAWSSTAYYTDFPQFVSHRNSRSPLSQRIDTIQWKPSIDISRYPGVPAQKRYYPFRHLFSRSDRDVYRQFKSAAPVNSEVTDFAIETMRNLNLGKRGDAIDMLNVAFTAAPYKYVKDGDYRVELEDTYLRLDSQLGRLLDAIDAQVGLDNAMIFLSSTGYYDDATPDDPKFRIPTGSVSLRRMESLLNSYYSAKYGNADYVATVYDGQVYLDRRQFDNHGVDYDKGVAEGRDFLVKMSGVADVRTLGDILADPSEEAVRTRHSIDPKTAGDIFITFNPGWTVVDDIRFPESSTPVRSGMVGTPFILMAPGVAPQTINTPVDASLLAPTITSTLHIRSPNGAASRPLSF